MGCIILSLLLLIALVKFWPIPGEEEVPDFVYNTRGQEVIEIEEILQTSQVKQKPPPPAPLPPIIVPNDDILEEFELEITDNYLPIEDPGEDAVVEEGISAGPQTALVSAQVGPKPVRFVEPEYTREARRKKIRAEVVVEVLVDERGQVQDAKILELFLLSRKRDEPKQPVEQIGFGLEESALSAAERWQFRPARQDGKPVQSYTTLTFSFGV